MLKYSLPLAVRLPISGFWLFSFLCLADTYPLLALTVLLLSCIMAFAILLPLNSKKLLQFTGSLKFILPNFLWSEIEIELRMIEDVMPHEEMKGKSHSVWLFCIWSLGIVWRAGKSYCSYYASQIKATAKKTIPKSYALRVSQIVISYRFILGKEEKLIKPPYNKYMDFKALFRHLSEMQIEDCDKKKGA